MNWFNSYGLAIMAAIMIPNVIFAAKHRNGFQPLWQNKAVETLEQIGRFGCFGLMIINLPQTYRGFWFQDGLSVYLAVNAGLVAVYGILWVIYFHSSSVFLALTLSILPSAVFLFSGIMLLSVPLIVSALIFAPCHIRISYQNALLAEQESRKETSQKKEGSASLPGYRKKSFAMPFGGGEIWFEHLDGLHGSTDLALQKCKQDWLTWKKPSGPSLLAINLDETQVDDKLLLELTDKLLSPEKRLLRVAFVGVCRADKKRLKRALHEAPFALCFENDFEKAKEWLIREDYSAF